MRTRQAMRSAWPVLIGCLSLAACHRDDAPANRVMVINGRRATTTPAKPAPRATPDAGRRAIPAIADSPPGPNPQLAKPAFRNPPLPRELTGDGDLIPLPPPPPPSAFGHGTEH